MTNISKGLSINQMPFTNHKLGTGVSALLHWFQGFGLIKII
ncbi:hypothetical protein [Flagellimonas okinawensis]|uniref:Uncharacterized protein n=1 Tax=Flagellimonas okinawensis TaxID=3031324 RepID=A0ABT5XTD3_9FLAO|nr:hypothetical protein [[Muricauda] okinawensis]MDF0708836.1 hypothetical protein [[Muricauda] okinawensis]